MKLTREQILQKFKESLPKHIGYGGVISQADLDQGDTAQRVGTLLTLLSVVNTDDLNQAFAESGHLSRRASIEALRAGFGLYRRSPNPSYWGYNPDALSRDQLSILKMGMASIRDQKSLTEVAIRQGLRFGFHQNTRHGTDDPQNKWKFPDLMAPGEMSVYNRGFLGRASVVPNFFWDMTLGFDLMLRKDDTWDVDNMLAINLLFANKNHPTLWSKLAMKSYLKTNFMERLWNYHKDEGNNGCEPLYWLFRLAFLDMYGYEPENAP